MMKKSLIAILLAVAYAPAAFALDSSIVFPFVTISLGIFVALSFIIITIISKKNQLGLGPWLFIAIAVSLLTIDEFLKFFGYNGMHQLFITSSMVLFFFTALFKYWDILRLVQ